MGKKWFQESKEILVPVWMTVSASVPLSCRADFGLLSLLAAAEAETFTHEALTRLRRDFLDSEAGHIQRKITQRGRRRTCAADKRRSVGRDSLHA